MIVYMLTCRTNDKSYIGITPGGYNLTAGGEGAFGVKLSIETRKKISETKKIQMRGKCPRPAGWHHSEESRRKIAEAGKGRTFSEQGKLNLRAAWIRRKARVL